MSKDYSDPNELAGVSEHSQQVALFSACAQYFSEVPELRWLFAIPNGGERNVVIAANMKAEGVKSGVSDIFLPVAKRGYHGFFIELKTQAGSESATQKQFGAFVQQQGYLYLCAHGWAEALRGLMWYLNFGHSKLWNLPS